MFKCYIYLKWNFTIQLLNKNKNMEDIIDIIMSVEYIKIKINIIIPRL